MMRSM